MFSRCWGACRGRWESCVGERHFQHTFLHFFPRIVDTGHSDFFQRRHPNHPHSTSTPPHGPFRARQHYKHPQTLCQAPEALNDHARSQHMTKAQAQKSDVTGTGTSPPRGTSAQSASGTAHSPAPGPNLRHHRRDAHGSASGSPGRRQPRRGTLPPTATTRTHAAGKARCPPSRRSDMPVAPGNFNH